MGDGQAFAGTSHRCKCGWHIDRRGEGACGERFIRIPCHSNWQPGDSPVIYGALLLIWADVEGIYDVKRLLDGKEVSLIKRKDEWLIDATWISAVAQLKEEEEGNSQERPQEQSEARLEDVVTFPDFAIDLKQTEAKEDRLGYEDYLRIMLWLENEKQVAIRFLDIVESDIKSVTEDTEFNLNRYADRIWVRANVHSEYEKEFSIYREFGY